MRRCARLPASNPDAAASGPAFGMALSERELWLGAGRSGRFVLDPERGEIASQSALGQPRSGTGTGAVRGPPGGLDISISAHRRGLARRRGPTSAGCRRLANRSGSAWPSPLERTRGGDAVKTLGQTGREAVLSIEQLQSGGFVEIPLPRAGEARVPSGKILALEGDGRENLVIVPGIGASAVWVEDAKRRATGVRSSYPGAGGGAAGLGA